MYEENVDYINKHNVEFQNGMHTFTLGINEYSDLSTDDALLLSHTDLIHTKYKKMFARITLKHLRGATNDFCLSVIILKYL